MVPRREHCGRHTGAWGWIFESLHNIRYRKLNRIQAGPNEKTARPPLKGAEPMGRKLMLANWEERSLPVPASMIAATGVTAWCASAATGIAARTAATTTAVIPRSGRALPRRAVTRGALPLGSAVAGRALTGRAITGALANYGRRDP